MSVSVNTICLDEAMKPCPNTPEFCPNGVPCIEHQNDTILEYQRGPEEGSHSSNTLTVDFYIGAAKVKSFELETILGAPDLELHTINLGLVPKWDSVKLTIDGTDGAEFSIFQIKEDTQIVFDLVARKGCETVWIDGKSPSYPAIPCYDDTVFAQQSFNREIHLNTSGNFIFEGCKRECISLNITPFQINLFFNKHQHGFTIEN